MPRYFVAKIPKTSMSAQERRLRSRAAQIAAYGAIIHGTLSERYQTCGKPKCRCMRGHKHRTLVLLVRDEGQVRQIQIPADLEDRVRRWLKQDHEIRDLLGRISRFQRDRILKEKKKKRRT